jgi:hypothetical protein
MKKIQLIVHGVELHERFSALVLDALDRLEPAPVLPPIPKGHVYFQASDGSLHSVPRKHLASARRIDPDLVLISQRTVANSEGSGSFTVTTARPRFIAKLSAEERAVLHTLWLLAFRTS